MFYNIFFTSLPIFIYSLFEQPIPQENLLSNPALYKYIRRNCHLSWGQFAKWSLLGKSSSAPSTGLEIGGCREPYGYLKFLQGAIRCIGSYAQHLQIAFEDAIGLTGKRNLISNPDQLSVNWDIFLLYLDQGVLRSTTFLMVKVS